MRRLSVLVCATALMAAGCGSSSHARPSSPAPAPAAASAQPAPPLTRARVLAAIAATRSVSSARENLTLALAGPSSSVDFAVDGVADFRTTTGTTTVASSRGQREQAVFRDGTVWLTDNAPVFIQRMPAGQRWVRASATALEAIGAFAPLHNSLAILDVLRGITSLHATGPDSGTFTFSLAQALARTPPAQRPALHNAIHTTGSAAVRQYGSVVLDAGGRVRSLRVVLSGVGSATGLFLGYAVSISAINAPVSVTPPATAVPLSSVPRVAALLRGSATGT